MGNTKKPHILMLKASPKRGKSVVANDKKTKKEKLIGAPDDPILRTSCVLHSCFKRKARSPPKKRGK